MTANPHRPFHSSTRPGPASMYHRHNAVQVRPMLGSAVSVLTDGRSPLLGICRALKERAWRKNWRWLSRWAGPMSLPSGRRIGSRRDSGHQHQRCAAPLECGSGRGGSRTDFACWLRLLADRAARYRRARGGSGGSRWAPEQMTRQPASGKSVDSQSAEWSSRRTLWPWIAERGTYNCHWYVHCTEAHRF